MKLGIDVFIEGACTAVKGKKVGLLTNVTGVNHRLKTSIDLLHEHQDIDLVALYAPEHGIRGDAKEGASIESSTDPRTGLPVFSLYGESKRPSEAMLQSVDVIVFDLQDIGSRYYTFIYSMAYMMEACKKYGKEFIVLDRPNPIGGLKMEGNLVEEGCRSFVGLLPIPNRHGLTVGELAMLFKDEFGYDCSLTVIPMDGWRRDMYYDQTGLAWVPPSPNAPSLSMALLYPGTCLVEGTNLSEGRGTTKPFEYIGAPFIDGFALAAAFNDLKLSGICARPTSFVPTYQKYKDEQCHGVQLHITNRDHVNAFQSGLALIALIAKLYPSDFSFAQHANGRYMFDLLAGTKQLRALIYQGESSTFIQQSEEQLRTFKQLRKPYLIYDSPKGAHV
ncbi:YzbB protein [Bacillus sp. JCM 19046]|nr:YzbB protein [Bacillus sp. JCM 19045]GAF15851.1 YzbB protein [Bacillus sp. JCM 19046]